MRRRGAVGNGGRGAEGRSVRRDSEEPTLVGRPADVPARRAKVAARTPSHALPRAASRPTANLRS